MTYTDRYKKNLLSVKENIINLEKLRNSSVLITGSNGLICSAVVDFLMYLNETSDFCISVFAAGRSEVRNRERFSKWANVDKFNFIEYDCTKEFNTSEKFDYIIHGASNASPNLYVSEPVETMLSNIIGLKTLLDYSRSNNVKRLLYISSSEVYGKKENNAPFLEDDFGYVDIMNVRACYSSSKRASETLCVAYNEEYGVDSVIVRPGHVYGPTMTKNDKRVSALFPRNVLSGNDIVMKSKGEQIRSYCYVADCVSAILTVLLAGKSGEAYNISNKNSIVTIKDFAECVAHEGNKKVIYEIPAENEKKAFNKMNNSSLNSDKLESLGWSAIVGLKDGVLGTLDAGL